MKIDFNQVLKDYDGKEMQVREGEPATLKRIAVDAIMAPERPDPRTGQAPVLPYSEVLKRDALARLIYGSDGPLELSTRDIELIKERIASAYGLPMVVAAAVRMLDPAEE